MRITPMIFLRPPKGCRSCACGIFQPQLRAAFAAPFVDFKASRQMKPRPAVVLQGRSNVGVKGPKTNGIHTCAQTVTDRQVADPDRGPNTGR